MTILVATAGLLFSLALQFWSNSAPSALIHAGSLFHTSNQSRNWAGYVATGGTFTAVAGSWTVPALASGQSQSSAATWVGIGGANTQDLIQAGTDETVARNGQVRYEAWVETLPQASKAVALTINAGDSVSVSIAQQAGGGWQVQITDNTTGKNVQKAISYTSSLSSAEWIEEAPSTGRRLVPLANFGTVQFTGGSTMKNGTQESIAQVGATTVTMVGRGGQALAAPSAVGSDGASFSVTSNTTAAVPTTPLPGIGVSPLPGIGVSPLPGGWGAFPPGITRIRRYAFAGGGGVTEWQITWSN